MVQTADLRFAFYERIYYQKRSPRSQDPTGKRLEIEDRRRECRCLRFADWSKLKFKKLRQIEIRYPPGSREAFLRVTRVNGEVREFPASRLTGTEGPLPPRFGATIDGMYREFPLILGDSPEADWPEETLARVLLVAPRPERRSSSRRH